MAVADVIRVELARRRSNQGHLAQILELSQPAIHRRMSGKVSWRVSELQAIADFLEIPIGALLTEQAAS
jgi:predicted transcriptional regulator